MWDIDLNCDSFWLSWKFCLAWFVASGQVGRLYSRFLSSILCFVYAGCGGKERLSLFVPVKMTLISIQVPLLFLFFFSPVVLFVFSLALYLHNSVFFLLLGPLAHWMQSLSPDGLTATVFISLFPRGGRTEQPFFGGKGSVCGGEGVFFTLNSCTSI